MVKQPRDWPPPLNGPHAASLSFAENSFRPLVCASTKLPNPTCAGDDYPSLEQLLCSLVHRAENPDAAASGSVCEPVLEPLTGLRLAVDRLRVAVSTVTSATSWLGRQLRDKLSKGGIMPGGHEEL